MTFLIKTKRFLTKHWKALVAALLVFVGYILGTSGNREKVLQKDVKTLQKAQKKTNSNTDKAVKKYIASKESNLREKISHESNADKKEEERREELLKDSSKLDKILKEKYGLKGE
jgi:spore germination cell wall hydrolase CwlJ-like protein